MGKENKPEEVPGGLFDDTPKSETKTPTRLRIQTDFFFWWGGGDKCSKDCEEIRGTTSWQGKQS